MEDVSFTASFGTLRDSERRQELCQNAEAGKPGARRPEPKVMKSYRIDYLFDGQPQQNCSSGKTDEDHWHSPTRIGRKSDMSTIDNCC